MMVLNRAEPCSMDSDAVRLERDDLLLIRRRVRTDLPYLRRFARALTGSQRLADMCVVELMDEVLESPFLLQSARNPRTALYRQLLAMLNKVAADPETEASHVFVSPPQRQARLLMTVEGFTAAETAEILNIEELAVHRLLLMVAADGSLIGSVSVLIIEDEPLICMQLEQIVLQLGHNILAIATTRRFPRYVCWAPDRSDSPFE